MSRTNYAYTLLPLLAVLIFVVSGCVAPAPVAAPTLVPTTAPAAPAAVEPTAPPSPAAVSESVDWLKMVAEKGFVQAITTNSVPWSYVEVGSQTAVGIGPDVMNAFFKDQGLDVRIDLIMLPFPDSIPALQAGHADMLLDLYYITDARKEVIDFAKPFLMDPEALLVPKGNPKNLHSMADLCGLKVGVNKGTAYADLANAENEKCPADKKMQIQYYPAYQGQLSDVGIGRIDATLIDAPVGAVALHENPDLGFQLVADYESQLASPISVMFPKGTTGIIPELDAYLTKIRNNGELAAILEKWGLQPAEMFLAPESYY